MVARRVSWTRVVQGRLSAGLSSGQSVKAGTKAAKINWNVNTLCGCLEDDESGCLAGFEGFEEFVLEDHFRVATILEAADEIGTANIIAVDIEAKAVRKQNAKRGQNAQDFGIVVSCTQDDDGKSDFGAILGDHVLHEGALFAGRSTRRIADYRPGAMSRANCPALLCVCRQ